MKMIFRKAHVYLYGASVAVSYFFLYPFFYYFSRKPSRYPKMTALRRMWGLVSSFCVGIRYKIAYEQAIDWSKTYIVCPNHTSNLDITSVSALIKSDYCFMGKQELADFFVTSLFFRTVDIPVDRSSKIASFRAFKKAMERVQSGITTIIFPEAAIPDDYPPTLHQFKNGPFRMAIELKVPIIPVTSLDTWKVLWDDGLKYGSKPGVCRIFVHKPIETAHLTIDDADALRDQVYNIINDKLAQA
ncbi:1-acyl-sn-glycerol-3-phosphate acyltransferase [Mucilaginibacter pallidiroseus]|uniref:1-acyl-sn-glycerol-3-phosphate acyltransferase n=1 Tax=Mucilaginibacter pallidiroseus TaxID=2599295 RepID=A0A563UCL4_9SPHI|nr:lysophospholipid acyltransferase family protein [Mucilaginibacter pallidiroseus]TWR29074.1 1-acyl-sn-glycerol-3-phosphate acyltransferase [Mucilaginibacter pallidiroseus]